MYTAAPTFDLSHGINAIAGLVALLFGLVILLIAMKTAWRNHGQGDVSGSMSSFGVVLISVCIAALGAGGLALAYGNGLLKAVTEIWS